jgi:hypothetical protein
MQIVKKNMVVFCTALALILMATVTTLHSHGQNTPAAARRENPTPVQEGVKTEKQREHGKIFSQKYEYRRDKRLSNLRGTGDLQVLIGIPTKNQPFNAPPFNLSVFLKDIICDSDAVIIGEVKNKSSQLTEYGEFAFTDYEVVVEELLKNNTASPIQPTNTITVTRSGGLIELNGKVIHAIDESFKSFEVGERVLLFLKFIPATGAYQTFNSAGSFKVEGNELVKLTGEFLPGELENEKDATKFINKVRGEASNTCNK